MIHPWLESLWAQWLTLDGRLPHAMLLCGPAGLGKRELAEALAARMLCESPRHDGQACGLCPPCQWRQAGSHPDLHRLVPEAEEDTENTDGATDTGEGKTKTTQSAAQIVIAQVRAVQEALTMTAHRGNHRVVIVDPAEAMNGVTANALLKLLEEPPQGCHFLLVSSAPRRLLPTIRSRCQQWPVPHPSQADLQRWQAQSGENRVPNNLLALCGSMPLAARRLAAQNGEALLERFVGDLDANGFDPLRLAAQWDAWLKKDRSFGLLTLVEWMQRWICDLAALRLGGRVRYFPAQAQRLAVLSARLSVTAATGAYGEFIQIRRVATHPLNVRLFLEDMLMRYARMFRGDRP